MSSHPIHEIIGKMFDGILPSGCELRKDKACGGDQRTPLFYSAKKSRTTELCNVDMLVLKDGKVKVVEIEESDVKPTQVCGKFLTAALARYYIHEREGNQPVEMDESVTFIQILSTSKLVKDKTAKFDQWKALEKMINELLPLKGSSIRKYRLFYGGESDFEGPRKRRELAMLLKEIK